MKNAKNIAIGLLTIAVLAIVGQMCAAIGTTAETVQVMPGELAGAAATRTAIAPAIVPTVRYNEVVLPTLQAEEANQITATTTRKYENARAWGDFVATCGKVAVGALTIFVAIFLASAAGLLIGAILCWLWERVKLALAYEPIQIIPDSAMYYPWRMMLVDSRTGRSMLVSDEHKAMDDPTHGLYLIESNVKGGARYRVQMRNGERHPVVLNALPGRSNVIQYGE